MSKWDRRAVGTLAVASFMLALGIALTYLHVTGPSDGARIPPGPRAWRPDGVVLAPVRSTPGGLQPDDVVVAVDGRTLESWAQLLLTWNAPRPQWHQGQRLIYSVVRAGERIDIPVELGPYPIGQILRREWGPMLFAAVFTVLAGFVFFRRPTLPAAQALLLSAGGVGSATTWSLGLQLGDLMRGTEFWLFQVTSVGAYIVLYAGALHLMLVFPQPWRFVVRHPWVIPSIYLLPFVIHPLYIARARGGAVSTLDWIGRATNHPYFSLVIALYLGLILISSVVGYRKMLDAASRRRIRGVATATALVVTFALAFGILPEMVLGRPLVSWNAVAVIGLLIPAAFAAGILQHKLFEIDVVLNRALVYGGLTAGVVGAYVLVVGYLGKVFQSRSSFTISLIAAGLVALAAHPLRERLQRAVNRWMYGERDDPYTVLSRLSRRLEAVLAPDAVLPAIVETVAQTLKLPYAAVTLRRGGQPETVAAFGLPRGDPLVLPLTYQGQPVGEVVLSPRAPGEPFSAVEQRLLADITNQIGVAAHAVLLTEDLQRSRQRLITAQEEERRRLRRDLHDGLGPALAAIALKLDAARNKLAEDARAVDPMLTELKQETQDAIADIRRLVYDLRPPALDELGLAGAIREHAARAEGNGLRVSVQVPDALPSLPAAVEVAAYRIAQEALTNVIHHARARRCRIRLDVANGANGIILEVTDDGIGLPLPVHTGVGLASIRERAAELGGRATVERMETGGTRVHVRLPVAARP